MIFTTTVGEQERLLVFKNGDYTHTLLPGKHFISPFLKTETFNTASPFLPTGNLDLYLRDAALASQLIVVDVPDNNIALHFENGRFKNVLTTGKYAYWKSITVHSFEIVDLNTTGVADNIDKALLSRPELANYIHVFNVEPHEKGLLFIDKKYVRELQSGAHIFWKGTKPLAVLKADMRQQQLDVSGQEIMTKDKVSLRLNFVSYYKLTDAYKVLIEIKDYQQQLYVLVQLGLREYVGALTLDEILEKKEQIGAFVTDKMQAQANGLGLELLYSGVKDIILPGDVKEIINQVLIAEKKAQANVIMRREETASTRSLLNTAKLMEENELLFKLKELEYVERISEKVSQISINGGGSQFLEQLKQVLLPLGNRNKEQ